MENKSSNKDYIKTAIFEHIEDGTNFSYLAQQFNVAKTMLIRFYEKWQEMPRKARHRARATDKTYFVIKDIKRF